MKKRVFSIFLAGLLLAVCLTGCEKQPTGTNEQEADSVTYEVTLATLKDSLNVQKKEAVTASLPHDIRTYGIVSADDAAEFTDEEIANITKMHSYQKNITLEQALDDLDILMRIIKTSYAGYTYFGGDESFGDAKERIRVRLEETYGEGSAMTGLFQNIVLEELSFVEDSHLMLGTQSTDFSEKYLYYDEGKNDFIEDTNGYFMTDEDGKWYLSKEDEKYLHLTVSDDGKLVYGLFILDAESAEFPEKITLSGDTGAVREIPLTWSMVDAGNRDHSGVVYSYEEKEGIPVVELGGMSLNAKDIVMTNDFINKAKELREQDVFILDLRGNDGGYVDVTNFFTYNLTGSIGNFNMQMVKRYSKLNLSHEKALKRNMGNTNGHADFSGLDFYTENSKVVEDWYLEKQNWRDVITGELFDIHPLLDGTDPLQAGVTAELVTKGEWTDYDKTIVVLIDKDTVSSGEYFLYELSAIKNVIIMGENSNGCMVTGDVNVMSRVYLPNTGISVVYGQALAITDKIDGFDASGWMPDVITRENALDAAIALLKSE